MGQLWWLYLLQLSFTESHQWLKTLIVFCKSLLFTLKLVFEIINLVFCYASTAIFADFLKNEIRLVVYKKAVVYQSIPFLQVADELFFSVGILQQLLCLSAVNTPVYIFEEDCSYWFVFCVESLLFAQKGHILHEDVVGCFELLLLAELEAALEQNVVIDWQIY